MKLPNKKIESKLYKNGYKHIVGVDEVGRGPLAGPVLAAAVLITKKFIEKNNKLLEGVRDSKTLSEKQREYYFEIIIKDPNIEFATSYCMPVTIDVLNILRANELAMKRAINKLSKKPDIVLVDGNRKINKLNLEQKTFVKGDQNIFSIACASIIAKVTRDRMMRRYAKKYPQYGFDIHKGYGTKCHRAIVTKIGPCPIHRKTFAPISELL